MPCPPSFFPAVLEAMTDLLLAAWRYPNQPWPHVFWPRRFAGNHRTVAGKYRSVTGNHRTVAGKYITVAGNHRTVAGNYISFAGNHRTVAGKYISVAGNHRTVTGSLAVPCPPGFLLLTCSSIWLRLLNTSMPLPRFRDVGLTIQVVPVPPAARGWKGTAGLVRDGAKKRPRSTRSRGCQVKISSNANAACAIRKKGVQMRRKG